MKYVDLGDTSPVSSTKTGDVEHPYGLNDILYGDYEENPGETIFLKGTASINSVPVKFSKATEFINWDNEVWGFIFTDNDLNFFPSGATIDGAIISTNHIILGSSNRKEYVNCVFVNDLEIKIKFSFNSGDTAPFKMSFCTFNTPKLVFDGVPLNGTPSFSFFKMYINGYGYVKPIIDHISTTSYDLTNVIYCAGNHLISLDGDIDMYGTMYHAGGVVYNNTSGTLTVDGNIIYKNTPEEIRVQTDAVINGKLYMDSVVAFDQVNLDVNGDVAVDNNGYIESMSPTPPTVSIDGNVFITGGVDGKFKLHNPIGLNNNTLKYTVVDPDNFVNKQPYQDSNLDPAYEIGMDAVNQSEPVFKESVFSGATIHQWSTIKSSVSTSGFIDLEAANNIYGLAKWGSYVIVEIDEDAKFSARLNDATTAFDGRIIFIINDGINLGIDSDEHGLFNTTQNAIVVIYAKGVNSNITIGMNTSKPNYFRGVVFNNGNIKLGVPSYPIHDLYGCIYDVSSVTTEWHCSSGVSVHYDSNVVAELTDLGVLSVLTPTLSTVLSIDMNECRVANSEGSFYSNDIVINNTDTDTWGIVINTTLPTQFNEFLVKENIVFDNYNNMDNLLSNTPSTVNGLWSSIRNPDTAVGSWYFGATRPSGIFYVDLESTISGDGSESLKYSLSQFLDFMAGVNGLKAVDGDILKIKGFVQYNNEIIIDTPNSSEVKLESIGVSNNTPWGFYGSFKFVFMSDSNILMKDCFLQDTSTLLEARSGGHVKVYNAHIAISGEEVRLTKSLNVQSSFTFACCNMSFSGVNIHEGINTTMVTINDTVFRSYVNIGTINGDITIQDSECSFASFDSTINTVNVAYGNNKIWDRLPGFVTTIDKVNYNYLLFDITNPGSGDTYWQSLGIDYGISGLDRYGIGYLHFEQDMTLDYYVDLDRNATPGPGTESDMANLDVLRGLLESASTVSKYRIHLKGKSNISDNYFLNISNPIEVNLMPYKPGEIGSYGVGFVSMNDNVTVIKGNPGAIVTINNMVISSNNRDILSMSDIDDTSFKVCVISSKADTTSLNGKYYGCTFITNTLQSSGMEVYDSVIKASEVL